MENNMQLDAEGEVLCWRVSEQPGGNPLIGSCVKKPCSKCKQDCYVSPSSVSFLTKHKNFRIVCPHCVSEKAQLQAPTGDQWKEIAENLKKLKDGAAG